MTNVQIKYFLTVAEYLSFTRASEILFVSQPAVTKQIIALEKELGFPLFIRETHKIKLTEAGLIMREAFLKMSDTFIEAKDLAVRKSSGNKVLNIGILEGMFLNGASASLRELKNLFPDLLSNFWRGQNDFLLKEFYRGNVDVIITYLNQFASTTHLNYINLFSSEFLILVSSNHPLARIKHAGDAEFSEENIIIFDSDRTNSFGHLKEICEQLHFDPKRVIHAPNFSSIFTMVENGSGVALIDYHTSIPNNDQFIRIPTGIYHDFVAAWQKKNQNPFIMQFISLLSRNVLIQLSSDLDRSF